MKQGDRMQWGWLLEGTRSTLFTARVPEPRLSLEPGEARANAEAARCTMCLTCNASRMKEQYVQVNNWAIDG